MPSHPSRVRKASFRLAVLILIASSGLVGCKKLFRLNAVPHAPEDWAHVRVLGVPGQVRYVIGDSLSDAAISREFSESWDREREYLALDGESLPVTAYLALSGGGDAGAFGAGLLNGWTAAGNRPQFKLVTGISTGALIAPFAFLGPKYDQKLKDFYTTISKKDVLKARNIIRGLTSDAMADSTPLRELLAKHVTREFLDEIAVEYKKGRELWIGTTNLDDMRRYIWNMTRIASSHDPAALDLFISLMLASSAIPGQFPPVLIDVEANGEKYQEMHVDGGASAQVFVYPLGVDLQALSQIHQATRERNLYIIRNSRIDPEWAQTERRTFSIAARAITSLIQTQGVGDLYRIYLQTRRDGLDFNLAYIPSTFDAPHKEMFDTEYMRALFNLAQDMAAKGYPWEKAPPGYIAAEPEQ